MKTTNKGFGRISIPLVTPFKENEEVNYEVYEQLINYVIEHDCCDSVISTGTTGEASALTFDERVKLFETAKKAVNGRCKLICGTGCASTYETIKLTKEAVRVGADYCLIVAPFYCKPNQEGIFNHYWRIAEETDAKIMLYNIPIFTGVNIEPETCAKLAEHPNIIGIKDESGLNPNQILDYRLAVKDPEFIIFNGDDVMLLPTIVQGAQGIISGSAHILGDVLNNVFDAFEEGKNDVALENFTKLYKFCRTWADFGRVHPNPILRPAIELKTGLKIGPARGPLAPITDAEMANLKKVMGELGLL
ncbi:MAG: 4-hydroxy-tetrahydrodipicolinate synthase [Erysipelotrichaceae bacterium]|nr:4-hydroxy-tetrahydrodipicolinate synthase [Erysipelotrichaceae bacterium]